MNIVYKYKLGLGIPLTASVATNNADPATGYAAGGGYEGAISAFSAIGATTAITAGDNVAAIPTAIATYEGVMVTYRSYDIPLSGVVSAAGTANIYKIPLLNLGIDPVNQKINGINFLNTYDTATNDVYPISDRFFYKYDFARKAIYFGYPNADEANYVDKGLKLVIALISSTV